MDKVLKILKNRWFLLGVSFLSFIYVVLLGKIVVNTFSCYLEISNFSAMMVLYIFINFIFGTLMFFTRKQIPTIIAALIIPIESFFLMIVGFGQWYLIIPPVIVSAVIFLSCGVGEACKTVMGTLLLIMFVVGALVYNIMTSYFGINVYYVATNLFTNQDQDIDFSTRSKDYLVSSDGSYRLVRYIDKKNDGEVISYYVEEAFKDEEYPFVVYRKVFGCKRVLVTAYKRDVSPKWISDTKLSIDGMTIDVVELLKKKEPENDTDTTTAQTSQARTTPAISNTPSVSSDTAG